MPALSSTVPSAVTSRHSPGSSGTATSGTPNNCVSRCSTWSLPPGSSGSSRRDTAVRTVGMSFQAAAAWASPQPVSRGLRVRFVFGPAGAVGGSRPKVRVELVRAVRGGRLVGAAPGAPARGRAEVHAIYPSCRSVACASRCLVVCRCCAGWCTSTGPLRRRSAMNGSGLASCFTSMSRSSATSPSAAGCLTPTSVRKSPKSASR
jgi:hypothetical protein